MVAAQRVARRTGLREAVGKLDGTARDAQFPQEAADAEQNAARIVAGDGYRVRGRVNAVALAWAGRARDLDGGRSGRWRDLPANARALFDFFDQERDGLSFRRGESGRRYDGGVGQIQRGGGRDYSGDYERNRESRHESN